MKDFFDKLEDQTLKTKIMLLIGVGFIVALLGYLIGYIMM